MQAYCTPSTSRNRFPDYAAYAETQAHLDYTLDQRRYSASVRHYTHTVDATTTVQLGRCDLADAQRRADGESLAALVCGYR